MRDGVNSRAVPGTLLLAVEGAAAGGQSLAQLSEVVTPAPSSGRVCAQLAASECV